MHKDVIRGLYPPVKVSAFRLGITALAATAWFAISNHCALACQFPVALTPAAQTQEHCPAHQSPADDEKKPSTECCKTLSALAALAKSLTAFDKLHFVPIDFAAEDLIRATMLLEAVRFELDTGPPASFAELVLQRSLFAHAPPSPA